MPADDSNREEIIHSFAQQNRLRTFRDTDETTVIPGQAGCHLYEYGYSELGLMVLSDAKDPRPHRWAAIRKKCLAADMTLRQNGDDEGTLSFDSNNRQQSRLAIKIAGCRPKRQLSPEHRARLRAVGFRKRLNPTLEGSPATKSRSKWWRWGKCPSSRQNTILGPITPLLECKAPRKTRRPRR